MDLTFCPCLVVMTGQVFMCFDLPGPGLLLYPGIGLFYPLSPFLSPPFISVFQSFYIFVLAVRPDLPAYCSAKVTDNVRLPLSLSWCGKINPAKVFKDRKQGKKKVNLKNDSIMENEIREREVVVDGKTLTLLRKDGKWVFPFVTYYQHGLGTPLCLALLAYVEDSNEFESEAVITVNLPGAERSAGCQFIDTNNNGEEVLDWLMLYGLCTPTGRYAVSGFCKYPEVDFYQSERFMQQKELCDRYFNFVD